MGLLVLLLLIVTGTVCFFFGVGTRSLVAAAAAQKSQRELRQYREQNRQIASLCRQQMDVEPTLAGLVLDQMDNTEREIER